MSSRLKNCEWRMANSECRVGHAHHSGLRAFANLWWAWPALLLCVLFSCNRPEVHLAQPLAVTADWRPNTGVFRVEAPSDAGAFVVTTDNLVVNLHDAELIGASEGAPDRYVGRGIVIKSAKNVTIKNTKIRGFKVAIYAEDAPGLTVENCDVSNNYRQHLKSTPEKEDESDWLYGHENDDNQWLRYGAGIYLLRCDGAMVKNCRARNGQNGVCLVRCNDATVVGNDMSFMSGWGLAMWRSNRCKVIGNRFDYCVRGYSHGVYARGQDSAGILVYEQCSDNVFAYNHATHGGDGFFLYAGNETVNKTGEGGCNRNLVYMNDFSHAVANGIEATFSDRNVFVHNRLESCEHGVWAGYSRRTLITLNELVACRNGVSIEHGGSNRIAGNVFHQCHQGVHLWWDRDEQLAKSAYVKKKGYESAVETVENNAFTDCTRGIRLVGTRRAIVARNLIMRCEIAIQLSESGEIRKFIENSIHDGSIENESSETLTGESNYIAPGVRIMGLLELRKALTMPPEKSGNWNPIETELERRHEPESDAGLWLAVNTSGLVPPDPPKEGEYASIPLLPKGKEHIVITEWGPWDFAGPRPSRAITTQPAAGR